jgi:tetratricopeptide (TPR) repeat protein
MKKLLLALLMCAVFQGAIPQPPPPPPPPPQGSGSGLSTADSLRNAGNISDAIKEYNRLYLKNPEDRTNLYNYACALSIAQQTDSCFRYLEKLLQINAPVSLLTDPDFISVREAKEWTGLEDRLVKILIGEGKIEVRDPEYAKALWKLLCYDQSCFYETGIAVRKLGPDSPVVGAMRRLQKMMNEKNLDELESLLLSKGWPKISQVGREAAGAAFFVLQHSNAGYQQKYIQMFEKACRENEGNWQQYALMFDRMRMNQNLPQKYGTHTYLDPMAGRTDELYPLEDESKVDEWRKEIGLEPLKDYLAGTGIKYVPRQVSKK